MSPDRLIFITRVRMILSWAEGEDHRASTHHLFKTAFFVLINIKKNTFQGENVNTNYEFTVSLKLSISSWNVNNFFPLVLWNLNNPVSYVMMWKLAWICNDLLIRAKNLICLFNIDMIQQYSYNTPFNNNLLMRAKSLICLSNIDINHTAIQLWHWHAI